MTQKTDLSYHQDKGYRLQIGYTFTAEGKKTGRVWWFGRIDAGEADFQAGLIREIFRQSCRDGIWTDDATAWARRVITNRRSIYESEVKNATRFLEGAGMIITSGPKRPAAVITSKPSPTTKAVTSLHAALDAYLHSVDDAPVATCYRNGIRDSIEALKYYRRDCTLDTLDYAAIEEMTNYIKSRPRSRKKNSVTGKKEPIRPHTVKRLLQHARQALKWIHRQRHSTDRFGGWKLPEDALELFGIDMDRLRTKAERDAAADGPEQITIEEIKNLYQVGIGYTEQHRLWFLTALFCGQGQKELAVSRRNEFDLNAANFIHRRNKTGQRGQYWLPPELVEMLRKHFRNTKPGADNLAFVTRDGQPLVTANSDAVRQAYEDWRTRCKEAGKPIRHGITFYSLRRYFAHRAAMIGGDSLRDAALAHSAKSVGGKHYSNFRDFGAVADVGRAIYADLVAAGIFAVAQQLSAPPQPHPEAAAA